jgi:signal transduction histidine kinase
MLATMRSAEAALPSGAPDTRARGRAEHEHFSSRRFVSRLVAATVVVNLIVVAFAGFALYRSHGNHERRAIVATQNLSQVLAQDLAASFSNIDIAVLAVKWEMERQLAAGRVDPRAFEEYIARHLARQPLVDGIRVANAQAEVVYGQGARAGERTSIDGWDDFSRLRAEGADGLFVSRPMIGQINRKWSIVLARRIQRPGGEFAGVAYAVIPLEHFQQAFARLDLGRRGAVSLRDLDLGTVVRHPEPQAIGTAIGNRTHSKEWPEKLKENPQFGSYFAVGLDNRNRALSYRRVAQYPFYIIVGQFPEDYLAEWWQEVASTLFLAALFALATLASAWLLRDAWRRREADAREREAERERLMLELHDGCIQSIYGIGLQLESARRALAHDPARVARQIADAEANLNLVIQDLRAFIAGTPREPLSEGAFLAEMQRIVPLRRSEGAAFTLEVERGVAAALDANGAAHVLRITQEAVSNVVRHANARRASVSLARAGADVRLQITDDGQGMPVLAGAGGLGLHHIAARARELGGHARVEAAPGGGTRISVEFPAPA